MINKNAVQTIERATMLIGILSVTSCVFFIGRGAVNYFDNKRTTSELDAVHKRIQELSETVSKSRRVKFKPIREKELSLVQTALDRYATTSDCQLVEVTSNNDEAPYLSHYRKNTEVTGWKQTSLQCQAVGTIGNILDFIHKVSELPVPVEVQTLEITPNGKVQAGRPVVAVKFGIQVMRREVKS